LLVFLGGWLGFEYFSSRPKAFDGERSLQDVVYQVSIGPRTPGSAAHQEILSWMTKDLETYGWTVEQQDCLDCIDSPINNLVAKKGTGTKWIILGAHYDSRMFADQDPLAANRTQGVPGGNDGASGVAVLLELARVLPSDLNKEVWLVFFDWEDDGRIKNYDWSLGSRAFVQGYLQTGSRLPDAAIIVDMVGDEDLTLYYEKQSDPVLKQEIWSVAQDLGYKQFIPIEKHAITDDHIPFLQAGIPAVDIIDIEYPYWHTIADTADKVSAESLEAVGATLLAWLIK
jgi:Zn-dependent M28 family amino/carboxypeptidase